MTDSFQKKSYKIAMIILILSIIPMLAVAVYSRPLADDFGYSAATHQVFRESHSLIKLFLAVGKEVAETYNDWQGSFSAIALFALEPAVFSEKIYGISTFILVFTFLFGTLFFIRTLIPDNKWISGIVFSAVSIICLQTLPHAMQGFYWWNGASYYTLFYSLMLILWSLFIKKKKVVISGILGFIIGGGNLVSGLLNLEVLFLIMIVQALKLFFDGKKEEMKSIWKQGVILLLSAIGFLVNVVAPGNQIRASESVSRPAFEAVGVSFLDAYQYLNEWMNLPVILLLIVILPFIIEYSRNKKSSIGFIPLPLIAAVLFCLFASIFTPTQYSMSEVGPRRIQNIRYFTFIIFMVFLEIEAVKRAYPLFEKMKFEPRQLAGYFGLVLVGVLIYTGIYTLPKENRNTVTSIAATRSFLIGESRKYAKERDAWTEILNSPDKEVTLKALYNHPVPIYYSEFDITGDPDDYRDQSMCDFYRKDHIILTE